MKPKRIHYLVFILGTIIIGLLARNHTSIPLWIGDLFYGTMVYYIFRFLFVTKKTNVSIIYAVLFCFSIEFLQLYEVNWLEEMRNTLFGKLVLGSGFLLSDLVAYLLGISIGLLLDKKLFNK